MSSKKTKKELNKKKLKNEYSIKNEVTALFIIATALLTGISYYTNAAGVFGVFLKALSIGSFGWLMYLIPLIIAGYGINIFVQRDKNTKDYNGVLILVVFLLSTALLHIISYDALGEMSIRDSWAHFYVPDVKILGGGFIGWLIAEPFINMFGMLGASIIIITVILVITMVITKISLVSIINAIKNMIQFIYNKVLAFIKYIFFEEEEVNDNSDITIQTDKDIVTAENNSEEKVDFSIEVFDGQPQEEKNHISFGDDSKETKELNGEGKKEKTKEIATIKSEGGRIEYVYPAVDLLTKNNQGSKNKKNTVSLRNTATKLEETLRSFGVEAKVLNIAQGPSVTRYELQPKAGVKVSKIVNLSDDIALNLAAFAVRIEAPIPGKAAIGIEVPNEEISAVHIRELIETDEFKKYPSKVSFALGKNTTGKMVIADISRMPHLLIAGATGSGKSVCINTIITSMLYKSDPNEVKLLMIDPKVVELGVYNGIPHLLIPVVTDPKKAAGALNWAVQEMVDRYKVFADNNVRDLKGYNQVMVKKGEQPLPQVVIIIDELADLMMVAPNDVEDAICRLAQMARAAGMHLIIATQRPSVDVITGVIKANIPSRISFAVSSQVDSRTILDMAGAEKLLGRGDMLFYPVGAVKPVRMQGAFISDKEVENVVGFIKKKTEADYSEDIIEQIDQESTYRDDEEQENDELLPQAIELVVDIGQASVSMLQRRLRVGYARAARLIDQMEARGIVGGFEGSKPRQVLINKQQYQEMIMKSDE